MPNFGMALNSAADIDALREIHARLTDLTLLAQETGYWFDGREGAWYFAQLAQDIRDKIHQHPKEDPHDSDCACWSGEPCDCLMRHDPDVLADRQRDEEMGV